MKVEPQDHANQSESIPLVVDMDGTLLRTDMLWECFVSVLFHSFWSLFLIPIWLLKGKVELKKQLAQRANLDFSHLPYNSELLSFIKREKEKSRKIYLASAGAPIIVRKVADQLDFFDDIIVSKDTKNLSSKNKAKELENRFFQSGFDYAGNSSADIAVWNAARKVIAVNCNENLVSKIDKEKTIIDKPGSKTKYFIKAIRPHQWFKNILIAIPMLSGHVININNIYTILIAFVSFSLTASSVYIINDLADLNNDRAHKTKYKRPFASANLSIPSGIISAIVLLSISVILGSFAGENFLLVLLFYFILTTCYSFLLKRKMIIDVTVLGMLYTVRMIAGISALSLEYSPWLLGFSLFIFLSLAIVKRMAELIDKQKSGQIEIKGRGYRVQDLPMLESMAAASAYSSVVVFFLYINSDKVSLLYKNPEILWLAVPVLVYWLGRILLISHRGEMHEDPVVFALTDKNSLLTGIFFLTVILLAAEL